ncbi:unnamed protein product [Ambrosiozyma monospora]|uniref:Unnamed protein product n=1 Tax=Ambrosiozyma monospora TaxID=43982 RepID=A0ACB5U9F2_AMBMO|nr:unnamed protein product [Ambrosiozyma monospora]
MGMVETPEGPRIRFTDLLLQIGFYSRFEDSTCLTLEDFIRRYTLLQKVNKIVRRLKIEATIQMVLDRMRYKINNKTRLRSMDFGVKRAITVPDILATDENGDDTNLKAPDPYNPFTKSDLYRSVSRASLNPFHDDYEAVIPTAAAAPEQGSAPRMPEAPQRHNTNYDDIDFRRNNIQRR